MRRPVLLGLATALTLTPLALAGPTARSAEAGPDQRGGPDFNGDGYDDLVIGDGYFDVAGQADAGAVWVVPGSATGVRPAAYQKWTQASAGIAGDPESSDYIGYVWTTGNFNGDRYDDLAICSLGETVAGVDNAGAVHMILGSSSGLRAAGSKLLSRNTAGVPGDPTSGERWCEYGLAAGDFNGDGRDDLAVASDEATVNGVIDAGSVTMLLGSGSGLVGAGAVEITQATPGVPGVPETGGELGYLGLGVGDFNGDGRDDLAVSNAYATVNGVDNAGALYTLFGSASGLRGTGAQRITKATAGIPGDPIVNGYFSYSTPAVADWDHDGYDDVVVADSYATVSGQTNAGQVMLLRGSAAGLVGAGGKTLHRGTAGVPGDPTASEYFGYENLATGDFDRNGRPDLAVSVNLAQVNGHSAAGAVVLLPGTATSIGGNGARQIDQAIPGFPGGAADAAYLSDAGTFSADYNGDGYDDLVIGCGYCDIAGLSSAGIVFVMPGSSTGPTTSGMRQIKRSTLPGQVDIDGSYFGFSY